MAECLATIPVAEGVAASLSRLLHSSLEGKALPQPAQAPDLGLDPTPFLAMISDVLRRYAQALGAPRRRSEPSKHPHRARGGSGAPR